MISRARFMLLIVGAGLVLTACTGHTTGATTVTSTSATLNANGSCTTSDTICQWYFQWGTGGAYQNKGPVHTVDPGINGSGGLSDLASGLKPGTTYQYQICGRTARSNAYLCVGPNGVGGADPQYDTFTTAGCDSTISPGSSVATLDQSLSSGQTGCLNSGTYGSSSSQTHLTQAGVTITAAAGASATIAGNVYITASNTTLTRLTINGNNSYSGAQETSQQCPNNGNNNVVRYTGVIIQGGISGVTVDHIDLNMAGSNNPGNAIGIGWNGAADSTTIRYSKIHDAGSCTHYDHLIYASHGSGIAIYDDWLWNDAFGWGIQLYPAPTNADIHAVVIDKAASGFTIASSTGANNAVKNTIVSNSTGQSQCGGTGKWFVCGSGTGSGNTVDASDSWQNADGFGSISGTTITNSLSVDPALTDPTNHNYSPSSSTPTSIGDNWGLWDGN
jgi:hypothetical protein